MIKTQILETWLGRIHIYSGLLSSTSLAIFGIIGIAATVLPRPRDRAAPEPTIEYRNIEIPGDMDDRQLADHIQADLAIPLTGPAPNWSLRRDDDGNLVFRLPTAARYHDVVVLEAEDRLRITTQPRDLWQYLFILHELTPAHVRPDFRLQAWAWYIEFSMWALIVMPLTGLYMWLSTRPRHRWARVSLAAGTLAIVLFYAAIR